MQEEKVNNLTKENNKVINELNIEEPKAIRLHPVKPKLKVEEVKPNLFVKQTKKGGWRVVYPWKNSDGSINWRNFLLGDTNLLIAGVIVIVFVLLFLYSYKQDMATFKEVIENPCKYCIEAAKVKLG